MSKLKRYLLIGSGTAALVCGLIGIFLPVLPTTPFLLLAALCYTRSSQKLYRFLLNNRLFGGYLKNYLEYRGMTVRNKVLTVVLLWTIIGTTIGLLTSSLVIRCILMAVGIGVTIHILLIHTLVENRKTHKVIEPKPE